MLTSSIPALPRLALTFCHASDTAHLEIINGLVFIFQFRPKITFSFHPDENQIIVPLPSTSITEVSTVLRVHPPLESVSVFQPRGFTTCAFSLSTGYEGSHVPCKRPNDAHAIYMPDATKVVITYPSHLS